MMMDEISSSARALVEMLIPDFQPSVTMEVSCSPLYNVTVVVRNEERIARSYLEVQPTVTIQSFIRPPVQLRRIRRRISSYPNPAPDFCFVPAVGVYQLAQPELDFWVEERVPQLYTVVILQLSGPLYLMFLDVNVPSFRPLYQQRLNLGARFQPIVYQPPRGEDATEVLVITYLQLSEFRITRAPGLMSLDQDESRMNFNLNAFTQEYELQPARLMVIYVRSNINFMRGRVITYDSSRNQSLVSQSQLGFGPLA